MFTEFDRLMSVQRIQSLCEEQGTSQSEKQITQQAVRLSQIHSTTIADAYEAIEQSLLATNPNPEQWD